MEEAIVIQLPGEIVRCLTALQRSWPVMCGCTQG